MPCYTAKILTVEWASKCLLPNGIGKDVETICGLEANNVSGNKSSRNASRCYAKGVKYMLECNSIVIISTEIAECVGACHFHIICYIRGYYALESLQVKGCDWVGDGKLGRKLALANFKKMFRLKKRSQVFMANS